MKENSRNRSQMVYKQWTFALFDKSCHVTYIVSKFGNLPGTQYHQSVHPSEEKYSINRLTEVLHWYIKSA